MSSPGGDEVGRVSVRVVPDTSGFRRELQRELEGIENSLRLEIPVGFDVDTAELRTKLESIQARVTVPVDLEPDIARLRAQLAALDNSRISIPVDLDAGKAIGELEAQLAAIGDKRIAIKVSVTGVTAAVRRLAELEALVSKLDGRNIRIRIDVDGLAAAVAQLATLGASLTALAALGRSGGGLGGLNAGFSSLAGSIVSGTLSAVQMGAAFLGVSAIATAVAIAGAGVTAAFGAAATAVAVLPAALALIGAPLGLLLLDMDTLGKRVGELTPAFQAFRKEATDAVANGLAPAMEKLANAVLPKVKGELLGVATTMGQVAQKAAEWAATGPGIDLINGVLANVNRTIQAMLPGLGDIGNAFLQLANQAAAFDVLSGAVNAFGESFRANVEALIGSGKMEQAFRGLGETLQLVGRGFSDMVHNGILLFAAAAPGVNAFLESLTSFFNRFDWTSLGASVGGVFQGLADTLDKVPQATIDNIAAAFERLSQTFQDPAIQQMFVNIISMAPLAINAINSMVEAFARMGSFLAGLANVVNGTVKLISVGFQAMGDPVGLLAGKYASGLAEAQAQVALGGVQIGQAFAAMNATVSARASEIPESVLAPLRGIPGAINTLNPQIAASVSALGGQSANAAERSMQGVPPAITAPLQPVPGMVTGALAPAEAAAQTATGNIGNTLQTGASQWGPKVDAGLQGISTSFQTGTAQWSTTVGTAITGVSAAITTGFAGASAAATTGMTGVTTAIAVGTANWYVAVSQGMTVLSTTVTTGFATLALAASAGMLAIQTAITAGTATWAVAVTAGLALLNATMAVGFQLMGAIATSGMLVVAAGITAGFAAVNAAIAAGMATAVAAVTAGMAAVQAAFVVSWASIGAAISGAIAQITAVLSAAMAAWVALTAAGWQQMVTATQNGMQQMVAAVTTGANQMVAALQAAISRCVSILNSAVGQFRAAGANMGQALADGLNSKAGAVEAAARRLANAAAAAVRAAAAIRSPSRVFIGFGEFMGEGLAIGMHNAESEVERAARSLAKTAIAGVAGIENAVAGDAWAADFNARVNSELAQHDVTGPDAAAGKQVTIQTTINNPLPETGSDSVAKTHRRQAAMGILG